MAESELLSVRGLSKKFGRVITADDVTFDVHEGEAFGIVGPNGAGKSTLLNLIGGVIDPDAGSIEFGGRDITRLKAANRAKVGIARSFQIPRPFVDMTVFENVYVGSSFAGGTRGQQGYDRAYSALETTGLLSLAETPAGQLRLLDRKRLELARALATGPRLILLDEIAGGLTEKEIPPLIDTIRGLLASGVTVVWIEHIVHALVSVVDRLMCLAEGRILAIGDPHEVMRSPEVIEVYLGTTFDIGEGRAS
jgi:branched-chain amino acid transport system ATP-binding protein